MSNKLPAFQFYPADWRKDPGVQALGFFERGVWFEILCLMHESESRGKLLLNGKPMPNDALARLLGLDKQRLTTTLTILLDYGVAGLDEHGALISRRMLKDEALRQIRAEAGKKGGNPVLLNQNSTKTKIEVKQILTPSSSSSSSTSSSEVKKDKPIGLSKKVGTRIPDPFELTDEMIDYAKARAPNVAVGLEHERFVNYWKAKAGAAGVKLDWPATWRNWMLRAQEYHDEKHGSNQKSSGTGTTDSYLARIGAVPNSKL